MFLILHKVASNTDWCSDATVFLQLYTQLPYKKRELLILRAPLASSPVSLTLLIFLVLFCVIFTLLYFVCLHSVTWPNVVCFFWIVHFTNIYIQIVDSIKYILGMFLLRKSYIKLLDDIHHQCIRILSLFKVFR